MTWIYHAPDRVNLNMIAADGGTVFTIGFSLVPPDEGDELVDATFTLKNMTNDVVVHLAYSDDDTRWIGIDPYDSPASVYLLPEDTDGLNSGTYQYLIREITGTGNTISLQYGVLVIDRIGSSAGGGVPLLLNEKLAYWALFVDRLFNNITYVEFSYKISTADVVWPDGVTGALTINSYDDFDEPDDFDCSYGSTYNVNIVTTRNSIGALLTRTVVVEAL